MCLYLLLVYLKNKMKKFLLENYVFFLGLLIGMFSCYLLLGVPPNHFFGFILLIVSYDFMVNN